MNLLLYHAQYKIIDSSLIIYLFRVLNLLFFPLFLHFPKVNLSIFGHIHYFYFHTLNFIFSLMLILLFVTQQIGDDDWNFFYFYIFNTYGRNLCNWKNVRQAIFGNILTHHLFTIKFISYFLFQPILYKIKW